jgi:hypothetical protein
MFALLSCFCENQRKHEDSTSIVESDETPHRFIGTHRTMNSDLIAPHLIGTHPTPRYRQEILLCHRTQSTFRTHARPELDVKRHPLGLL